MQPLALSTSFRRIFLWRICRCHNIAEFMYISFAISIICVHFVSCFSLSRCAVCRSLNFQILSLFASSLTHTLSCFALPRLTQRALTPTEVTRMAAAILWPHTITCCLRHTLRGSGTSTSSHSLFSQYF